MTIVALTTLVYSCGQTDSNNQTKNSLEENKLTLNIETIDTIYLVAYCGPMDSCNGTLYQLKYAMIHDLIDRVNKSSSKGSCNFDEEYLLYVHFKDGTTRNFRINGSLIKDNNDRCFDIKNSNYFENLWIGLNKEWIELNKK